MFNIWSIGILSRRDLCNFIPTTSNVYFSKITTKRTYYFRDNRELCRYEIKIIKQLKLFIGIE